LRPRGRPPRREDPERRTKTIDEAVAVVIVNYRTPKLTAQCLAALEKERPAFRRLRALVVDGGSADDSLAELTAVIERPEFCEWVTFLALPVNGGFGWANNEAIRRLVSGGQQPLYVHILNPDAEVEADAVRALAEYLAAHPRVAAVGSQLLEPDGSLTDSAFNFPTLRGEISRGARTDAINRLLRVSPAGIRPATAAEVDWTTGASVMFRVEALRQVGLFDEGFFLYHEELELMWRFRKAGWGVALEPRSRVRHLGGAATGLHQREAKPSQLPRRPGYWFRSRARYFALSRGTGFATAAFFAWLMGYLVWFARRRLGLAPDGPPIDRVLRDHLANSFPRIRDAKPAVGRLEAAPGNRPIWMQRGAW
jgi:N-acetylglucosaminyl-diphospho-decaprenol L-rhamnosyltransferase